MKIKLLLAATLLSFTTLMVKAQQITIGTFNIRYDNPADSGNLWVNRAPIVSNLIRFHKFDVLGIQEGLKNQLDDISNALPEYARYGKGRDDGKDGGEHSAIFYRKDRFKLLKSGDFWLSENPDQPGKGWDATCCNRICSWVFLEDVQTKKKFYTFNVHYDHQGVIARKESSKLYNEDAIVVEPAGALSVAALDQLKDQIAGKTVVCIVSGGNNDIERMQEIKEKSLLFEGLKHYFIVRFPQRPGALKLFVNEVLGPQDDITRFEFIKKTNKENGPALVGIELSNKNDYASLLQRMKDFKFEIIELNQDQTLFEYLV